MRACAYKCGYAHANANTCIWMCACVFTWGREKSSSILSFLSRANSPLIKCIGCKRKTDSHEKVGSKVITKLSWNCYRYEIVMKLLCTISPFSCWSFFPVVLSWFHHSIFIDCFYVHFPHYLFFQPFFSSSWKKTELHCTSSTKIAVT